MGQLLASNVDELRDGLGNIRRIMRRLINEGNPNVDLLSDLNKIDYSVQFCELVLRNLVTIGEDEETYASTEIDLETIIRETFFMLERKLNNIKLTIQAAPEALKIKADEGQIKQLFINLIKNAGEAMPGGGNLYIDIVKPHQESVHIKISDEGCGILQQNLERIFDLYFTTKDVGTERSYGIGLHIVQSIVNRLGGSIEVDSEVGKGTTFTLLLPVE